MLRQADALKKSIYGDTLFAAGSGLQWQKKGLSPLRCADRPKVMLVKQKTFC